MDLKITEVTGLITVLIALSSFIIYIDNKYIDTTEFTEIVGLLATTMYENRLSYLKEELVYEYTLPNDKDNTRIIALKTRIESIKKNREKFLNTGHLPIGDAVTINRAALKKVILE